MAPNILDSMSTKTIEKEECDVRSRIIGSDKKSQNENVLENNSKEQSHLSNGINKGAYNPQEKTVFKPQVRWPDLIAQIFIHVGSLYGLYYLITLQANFNTYIWCKFSQTLHGQPLIFIVKNQFSSTFSRCAGLCIGNRNYSR